MAGPLSGAIGHEIKRTAEVVILCAIAMLPPMISGRIIFGAPATTVLLFGSLVGFLNTAVGGRHVGAAVSLAFLLVVPVTVMVGGDPIAGASLMVLAALFTGAATHWARLSQIGPTVLVGMVFLVGAPSAVVEKMIGGPTETRYLLGVLAATAVCAFWPVILVPKLVPIKPASADTRNSIDATLWYTGALAILVGTTIYWALDFARNIHGIWLPLTIVLVLQATPQATRHRLVHRVVGTVAGSICAVTIATLIHNQLVVYLFLILALIGIFATMGREPYGLFVFFLTILVLIGVSANEPAIRGGEQRVLFTMIGAALAAATLVAVNRITRRRHQLPAPA